jgi:hypothetical protein
MNRKTSAVIVIAVVAARTRSGLVVVLTAKATTAHWFASSCSNEQAPRTRATSMLFVANVQSTVTSSAPAPVVLVPTRQRDTCGPNSLVLMPLR